METAEIKNTIWEYTRKIKDSTNKAFSPLCEKYGLTMMQGRIIMELCHYGPRSIGNLADSVSIAGANLSAMCKKMEGQGLLERKRDPSDERMVKVALTEYGKQIADDIDKSLIEKIKKATDGNKGDVLNDIIKGMFLLTDLLEKISEI